MVSSSVFVSILCILLLMVIIVATLRWWQNRVRLIQNNIREATERNNNSTRGDAWVFTIERGRERQLIEYNEHENFNSPMPSVAEMLKSRSRKNEGLPTYEEAIKAQTQVDNERIQRPPTT